MDKSALGISTGDQLLQINGRSLPGATGTNTTTEEAGYFDYTLVGNDYCARNGVVLPPVIGTPTGAGPVIESDCGGSSKSCNGGSLNWLLLMPLMIFGLGRRFSFQLKK